MSDRPERVSDGIAPHLREEPRPGPVPGVDDDARGGTPGAADLASAPGTPGGLGSSGSVPTGIVGGTAGATGDLLDPDRELRVRSVGPDAEPDEERGASG